MKWVLAEFPMSWKTHGLLHARLPEAGSATLCTVSALTTSKYKLNWMVLWMPNHDSNECSADQAAHGVSFLVTL